MKSEIPQREVTHAQVLENLRYDPGTGVFTRISNGKHVGRKGWKGYLYIDLHGSPHPAHRLAWMYMTGKWPVDLIDHKDGDKGNNRLSNLRPATNRQNRFNDKGHPRKYDLPRGVRRNTRSERFRAEIKINGKSKSLGSFDTPEEASEFYQLAADLLHGEFAYHRGQGAANLNTLEAQP